MIDPVHKYIKDFANAGADIITIHPEATPNTEETIKAILDVSTQLFVEKDIFNNLDLTANDYKKLKVLNVTNSTSRHILSLGINKHLLIICFQK